MAEKEDLSPLGRTFDGGTRTGGFTVVRDVVLPTPHNEYQSTAFTIQSPALLFPASCAQKAFHPLVAHPDNAVCIVYDWQSLPALC